MWGDEEAAEGVVEEGGMHSKQDVGLGASLEGGDKVGTTNETVSKMVQDVSEQQALRGRGSEAVLGSSGRLREAGVVGERVGESESEAAPMAVAVSMRPFPWPGVSEGGVRMVGWVRGGGGGDGGCRELTGTIHTQTWRADDLVSSGQMVREEM